MYFLQSLAASIGDKGSNWGNRTNSQIFAMYGIHLQEGETNL